MYRQKKCAELHFPKACFVVETTGTTIFLGLQCFWETQPRWVRPSNVLYREGQYLGMFDAVHRNTQCLIYFYNEQGSLISLSLSLSLSCSLLRISVRRSTPVTRSFRSITKLWCVSLVDICFDLASEHMCSNVSQVWLIISWCSRVFRWISWSLS